MKNYIAFGLDFVSKKKVEVSVQAKDSDNVRVQMCKKHPRIIVQAVFPDLQIQETEEDWF